MVAVPVEPETAVTEARGIQCFGRAAEVQMERTWAILIMVDLDSPWVTELVCFLGGSSYDLEQFCCCGFMSRFRGCCLVEHWCAVISDITTVIYP